MWLKLCDVETATSAKKAIDALITNAKAPAVPASSPAGQSEPSLLEPKEGQRSQPEISSFRPPAWEE